jgi:hypothetical protein
MTDKDNKRFKTELYELLKKYNATIEYDNESGLDMTSGSMIASFGDGTETKLNDSYSYVDSHDLKNNL